MIPFPGNGVEDPDPRAAQRELTYEQRRAYKLRRAAEAEAETKRKLQTAKAEYAAAAAEIADENDPEVLAAIAVVMRSVRKLVRPEGLEYLLRITTDDALAGAIRWRELARLDVILQTGSDLLSENLGVDPRGRKPGRKRFSHNDYLRLADAITNPRKRFKLPSPSATGKMFATIFGLAKRANVAPSTLVTALCIYGMERLASSLRGSREAPPLSHV